MDRVVRADGAVFVRLPDDPPGAIDAIGVPGGLPPKEYFDANLKCGELPDESAYQYHRNSFFVPGRGCGASDWDHKRILASVPGLAYQLTCRKCRRVKNVEVRHSVDLL